MKKLLAILVLGLFLTSCTQQNRSDEYLCKFISGKRQQDDVTLEIFEKSGDTTIFKWFEVRVLYFGGKSDRIILELSLKTKIL